MNTSLKVEFLVLFKNELFIFASFLIAVANAGESGPIWNYNTFGDPPLILTALPDTSGDGLTELLAPGMIRAHCCVSTQLQVSLLQKYGVQH